MKKIPAPLRSMTAFGEAQSVSKLGHFVVEIKSVNRRHLEVQLDLPRPFSQFEADVRGWVIEKIGRGQVNISLFWKKGGSKKVAVSPNLSLAKEMKKGWDLIAKELKVPYDFTLSLLSNEKDLFIYEEGFEKKEVYFSLLKKAVNDALEKHQMMREQEGKNLAVDIKKRLLLLKKELAQIEKLKDKTTEDYREKLTLKMEALFAGEWDERILKEVILFAEKSDVTEEIVRFKSHLKEFEDTIEKSADGGKGKKLEFLLQELGREINTLGNKVMSHEISKISVDMKSELEKIREQIQNVE